MFDVFTEEIEVLIKDGISNLYWYNADLYKAWVRSGVTETVKNEVAALKNEEGTKLSKRRQMDELYERLKSIEFDRRLEISRNFVRLLIEQKSFAPQNEKHRTETAERASLKLRALIQDQEKSREYRESIRNRAERASRETYDSKLGELRERFSEAHEFEPQQKGYAFEGLFTDLMRVSGIPVEEPFKIVGEQIDGAIKYDGHYYLIELKWTAGRTEPKEIAGFYYKVDGKMQGCGIFLAMNGYTAGALENLPTAKELKVLLLDGQHIANVFFGMYTFQELLEHAIKQASIKGSIYCSHNLSG
jgi:hypothetical protein